MCGGGGGGGGRGSVRGIDFQNVTLPYSGFYWQILNLVIWRIGLESPILKSPLIIA